MSAIERLLDFETHQVTTMIIFIFAILFAWQEILKLYDTITNRFGIETKRTLKEKKEKEVMQLHEDRLNTIDENQRQLLSSINVLKDAMKVQLRAQIEVKYKQYTAQDYIPYDEYDDFISLHDSYNALGGNHNGDFMFDKCMELQVKVDERS